MEKRELLRIENLKTHFYPENLEVKAVDGVDFTIYEGEVVGLVGESGSGKSVTSLSIMQLIPDPPGKIEDGHIYFKGVDLLEPYKKGDYGPIRKIRGNEISMIFQEPMTSLNPVFTVGYQVAEPLMHHHNFTKEQAYEKATEMLEMVGISDAKKRLNDFPHQFSGGMRQRVMIAMALGCNPSLLIADEPTTALDVTIQAQILDLMLEIKNKRPESAILLITHDLAVVSETCQRVVVLYCGKVQEIADIDTIFYNPAHPYTQGLLNSIPKPGQKVKRLPTIDGMVPALTNLPKGCSFCPRCSKSMKICEEKIPELVEVEPGHFVRCHLVKPGNFPKKTPKDSGPKKETKNDNKNDNKNSKKRIEKKKSNKKATRS